MKLRILAVLLGAHIAAGAAEVGKLPGPLLEGLGDWRHGAVSKDRKAQRYFDQGMSLLYAFNHKEAIRSFRSAAVLDPDMVMAHWGVAYAYGPHVNRPMTPEDNREAWVALQHAVARRETAGKRDRAYVEALQARYTAELPVDRSGLDRAFADAMRRLVEQFPDDLDARTLFAESLMNTMPWDYWAKDRTPKPDTEEAFAALRYVLSRDPDHPGANHFYIHAVEAGPNPEMGLPSADRLARFAPGAGHLVHMSAHIYMRVGQYADAVTANERAIRADQDYIRRCRAQGFYVGAYYPHNLHFLWWAQLADGRSSAAIQTAAKAADFANDNYCGPSKAVEAPRLRHLPWITALRFGRWDDVLSVPQPPATNDFLVDRAMWHFSRGLALAGQGKGAESAAEHIALKAIISGPALKAMDSPMFPVATVLSVAEAWLSGRVAGLRGDNAGMVRELERARAIEDAMPYMEPAYWPIPVRPALGAALLATGDAAGAERVFREDLKRWPRNAWGLLGLEKSLRAQGRVEGADLVRGQFQEAWARADVELRTDWF